MRMQDKILAQAKKIVEDAGHEWVQNQAWANTGIVYVHKEYSFDVVTSFKYFFQDEYATIYMTGPVSDAYSREFNLVYTKPATITEFLDCLKGKVS